VADTDSLDERIFREVAFYGSRCPVRSVNVEDHAGRARQPKVCDGIWYARQVEHDPMGRTECLDGNTQEPQPLIHRWHRRGRNGQFLYEFLYAL
jgi:hypothetical protein